MTKVDAEVVTGDELVAELSEWLKANWDPDLTVADWWERLGTAGWSAPTLPTSAYGRGVSRADAVRVAQEIGRFGALGAPGGLGLLLAAPTIAAHGTQEQIDHFVRDIVTGQLAWCQLFSEPGAGSDLAGLTTRAVRDGEEWVVNGQKVWTSGAQMADMGMLLARTNVDVPKHQGITWFALDMHQSGIDVRPLREMSGSSLFNEVFFTDAHVGEDAVIGGVNNGWSAANTTLANERAGLGAGGGAGGGFGAMAGTVGNQLSRRAGDFVSPAEAEQPRRRGAAMMRPSGAGQLTRLAKTKGVNGDPVVRQGLAKLHTMNEVARYNAERLKAVRESGGDIPGMANIAKLTMSDIMRLTRDLGLSITGVDGTLHAYDDAGRKTLDNVRGGDFSVAMITALSLYAQAPPIYGGTDQIQRNIIGERALGLPKEPGDDRTVPFSELPKNG
jgi:alkylation response protein AidB-like acyl-CoA dehydrogenase